METVKTRKRAPRWTQLEIEALVISIEHNRKHILDSFLTEVTAASKQQAWKHINL